MASFCFEQEAQNGSNNKPVMKQNHVPLSNFWPFDDLYGLIKKVIAPEFSVGSLSMIGRGEHVDLSVETMTCGTDLGPRPLHLGV